MFENYRDVVDVKTMCHMLKIGRNTAYQLLHSGQIKFIKIGRQMRISKQSIIQFICEKR